MELNGLQHSLSEAQQSHLIKFWDDLNDYEKARLVTDLSSIDFKRVNEDFARTQGVRAR